MSVKGGGKKVYSYILIGKLILVIWNRLFLCFGHGVPGDASRQLIFLPLYFIKNRVLKNNRKKGGINEYGMYH